MNSLFASRFHYEYTICFENFLWIHYLLCDFSLNSILISGIQYLFREFTLNPIFNEITYRFTIFFAISIWIHYLIPQNHYKYTIFREINLDSLSASQFHFEFTIFFSNSLLALRISYEFTICFAISLGIHYLFCEFTWNPLFSALLLWIHYVLRVLL